MRMHLRTRTDAHAHECRDAHACAHAHLRPRQLFPTLASTFHVFDLGTNSGANYIWKEGRQRYRIGMAFPFLSAHSLPASSQPDHYCSPHWTDKEMEVQAGGVTCSRSHSYRDKRPGYGPLDSEVALRLPAAISHMPVVRSCAVLTCLLHLPSHFAVSAKAYDSCLLNTHLGEWKSCLIFLFLTGNCLTVPEVQKQHCFP